MELGFILSAFIAGLLTFLAPCTLPLVPAYLGFISGVSIDDLKNPRLAHKVKLKIFLNGLLFVLGFSLVFIMFGTLIGVLGASIRLQRVWITKIGGLIVIFFGLVMLRVFNLPILNRIVKIQPPHLKRGKSLSSFVLGASFASGWTPCVGPILGSILLLASTTQTIWKGAFLLFVFSLGLAVPFLLVAVGAGSAMMQINKISKYLPVIEIIGGLFLVALGVLLFIDNLQFMIIWGYQLLRFINYERLIDYL